VHHFAVISPQHANIDLTQSQGLVEHRVEHRREVARRGVDDLQHLGGRSLTLQRLVTLGFALVTLGLALGKFSLTLGKLTFEIGDPLIGIG